MQRRFPFGTWLLLWLVLGLNTRGQGTQNPAAQWETFIAAAAQAGSNPAEEERLLKLAVQEAEKFGPSDPRLALSLSRLAESLYRQKKYTEAEPLLKRSLPIIEKVLGPEHADVATSLNVLADLYGSQGEYGVAEPLYRRSLAIREKALGPEHPDVATNLNNPSFLYDAQGKYGEAEGLDKRSLAIREKVLGPEHQDVARSLSHLANLYHAQGKYAEVEPLFSELLSSSDPVPCNLFPLRSLAPNT